MILRWLHVIGACVLLGTGAGIAFFMMMAHRTRDARLIAHTAGVVVLADLLFTTTAVVVQPITGGLLAWRLGWPFSEGWLALSLILYVLTGAFWLPVVWIQLRLRDLARAAAEAGEALPARYHRLFTVWFACGFPAFAAVLAIVWLMLARPDLGVWLIR
ncbi:membrane protein [Leisingera sp. ANG-M1]|nr:membrane protein [Leisingera sp. ANG-M1]